MIQTTTLTLRPSVKLAAAVIYVMVIGGSRNQRASELVLLHFLDKETIEAECYWNKNCGFECQYKHCNTICT